ncbi:uncharacterized protein [Brachionichthys hirsutus]|uniref:uncharacterized protein n=1 Tax=Brachionichthys hirsutus TaxID=412623 RepID=UPI0036048E6C
MDNQASHRPERRTAIISRELRKFQIDIAALSETRLADEGQLKEEKGGYTFFWKGKPANEPRIHGVGFAIKNCLINHLHELPVGVSERLMTVRLTTVISADAPTLDAQDEVKEAFSSDLDKILSEVPKEDKLILLGDFNARVGRNHHLWRGTLGRGGVGNTNSNGLLLLTKCSEHNLAITNTLFRQRTKFKTSWMHPRSKLWHLIDYIIVHSKDRRDVINTRAMTGADNCWTDHRLIRSVMSIRLMRKRRVQKRQSRPKLNLERLDDTAYRQRLQDALGAALPKQYPEDTETHWRTLSSAIMDSCKNILGHKKRRHQDWYDENDTQIQQLIDIKRQTFITWQNNIHCKQLFHFTAISSVQLTQFLTGIKTPTCSLDPIPSPLIKTCLPIISPLITRIINSSITSGSVPQSLKLAAITPILKKPGLDPENLSNFRPISNLPFLSKILERVIAAQLQTHLNSNSLFEPFQSGFRPNHSTETALIKVTNDLLLSSDSGHLSILILLDLTAAFDTISHSILLSRLKTTLNITGSALSWLQSYLTNRQQFIHINHCSSSTAPLLQGVPQGSVLGPLLFILYILPLGDIIRRHSLHFHCYADDIQLYITTNSIDSKVHSTVTNCLNDIKSWMKYNFLKVNSDKTDIILIGSKNITKSTQQFGLDFDNTTLTPSPLIRNLGVILDSTLSFHHHVRQITRTAFFHLKNIARLRPSLTFSAAETLIHAFVTSRIDYCNSILYGLPSTTLHKLQYIQNSAARLLTHTRSREHITPVLKNLHWLPVPQRIQFKVLLITFKALHNLPPPYLTDLLHHHTPSCSLRSADANLLSLPCRTKLRTWGDRAFSIAAPTLWNTLPQLLRANPDLNSFKKDLKTYLFNIAFTL